MLTLAMGAFAQISSDDPVVIRIDGEPIYKSEFEYVYNKNNANAVEKKSLDEYAELFVNYKLKVLDAKEKKYDENYDYLAEVYRTREQMAIPFIIDDGTRDNLVKEAYERSKTSVAVSHILVKTGTADTVSPFLKISKIYNELNAGANFAELAKKYSDCPSGKGNGGYLGYANVFDMVYPFENAMYNTPVGQYSKPFASEFGYHIVKVSDRKPNINSVKISQIFIGAETPNAEKKIDSLLAECQKKKNLKKFNKIAEANTQREFNGTKDGHMPWISRNNAMIYPPEFISNVMSLSKTGEMRSFYIPAVGYMIARLDSSNLDLPFDSVKGQLTEKVLHGDRASVISSNFLANLENRTSYAILDSAALFEFIPLVSDSTIDVGTFVKSLNKPMFTMMDITYPQSAFYPSFSRDLDKWKAMKNGYKNRQDKQYFAGVTTDKDLVLLSYKKYVEGMMTRFAYDDLKKSNPEYKYLYQEYSDGLLLYNISLEKVWNKAARGNDGLYKYFEANKQNYQWKEPHFVGRVIYSKNTKVKKQVDKLFDSFNGNIPSNIDSVLNVKFDMNDKSKAQIKVKELACLKGKNKAVDYYVFKEGSADSLGIKNFPEVSIYGNSTTDPTNFSEFRGQLVTDYQEWLDKTWIEDLRKNHVVEIDQNVLKTVNVK